MKDLENKLLIIIFLIIIVFLIYLFIQHTKQENQIPNRDTIYVLNGDENDRLRRQNSRLRRRYLDRIENDRDRRYYDREIERVRDDTQRRIRELEQQVQESNQEPINTNGGPALTERETLETFNNSDNLYLF